MSDNDFLEKLGLSPGIDINVVERLFVSKIQTIIANSGSSYDEDVLQEAEREVKTFYKGLSGYAAQWQKDTLNADISDDDEVDHVEADSVKKRAKTIQSSFQKLVYESAIAMLHITRHVNLVSGEVEALTGSSDDASEKKKSTRGAADLGSTFNRNRKEKERLTALLDNLQAAFIIAAPLEEELITFERQLKAIYKDDTAAKYMRRLKSNLRTEEFVRAKKHLKDITGPKKRFGFGDSKNKIRRKNDLRKASDTLLELVQSNADILRSPDYKLYLSQQEVQSEYIYVSAKLRKIKDFIVKNYVLFILHRLEILKGLKTQLDNFAMLSEIMNLYTRLISDSCYPLSDLRTVREFETQIVEKTENLVKKESQTPKNIQDRADAIVTELRLYQRDFFEMSKLNIPEKLE